MSEFLAQVIEIVRQRSATTESDDEAGLLNLAAHLFAIAASIPTHEGSAALADASARQPPFFSSEEIIQEFSRYRAPMVPERLYWRLVSALVFLDNHLAKAGPDLPTLRTKLVSEYPIGGEVVHWLRPTSNNWFRAERSRRRRLSQKRPAKSSPHPSDSLQQLAMFWNGAKGPHVQSWKEPRARHPLIRDSGREAKEGAFRIALCPLPKSVYPQFEVEVEVEVDTTGRFFCARNADSLVGKERLLPHLEDLIQAATRDDVHLIVLPELMIDGEARQYLAQLMRTRNGQRPYGVIAGSFHFWPHDQPSKSSPPANQSWLLGTNGDALLKHQKRGKFRLTPHQVLAVKKCFPTCPAPFPDHVDEILEWIDHGSKIEVLETTLGRLVVVICADCIALDLTNLNPCLMELRPDLLIIVSMSPKTGDFVTTMNELARRGISSVFVNARPLCRPAELLAAAHLGLLEPAGAPPTRIRWRQGESRPEVCFYNPKQDWFPLSTAQEQASHGIGWLGESDQPLGLVIDLGVHGKWTPPPSSSPEKR